MQTQDALDGSVDCLHDLDFTSLTITNSEKSIDVTEPRHGVIELDVQRGDVVLIVPACCPRVPCLKVDVLKILRFVVRDRLENITFIHQPKSDLPCLARMRIKIQVGVRVERSVEELQCVGSRDQGACPRLERSEPEWVDEEVPEMSVDGVGARVSDLHDVPRQASDAGEPPSVCGGEGGKNGLDDFWSMQNTIERGGMGHD